MKTKIAKTAAYWLGVVALGLVVGVSIQFVTAWTEPTAAPPGGNVGAPVNTSSILQAKLGDFIAQNLGAYNLTLVQKGYSVSTTAADLGTTLATKDYVDAQGGGSKWIFLNDLCETPTNLSGSQCTASVNCPSGTAIVGFTSSYDRITIGSIANYLIPTVFPLIRSCDSVTLGSTTSLSCTLSLGQNIAAGKQSLSVAVICSE